MKAARDAESGVWFVESSDMPGLNLEAASFDALADKLPDAILDLLEAGGSTARDGRDVLVELIGHASTRVRVAPRERLREGSSRLSSRQTIASLLRQGRGDHEVWTSPCR